MSETSAEQVKHHATAEHEGFSPSAPEFETQRAERTQLVEAFLAAMADAGNPGLHRKLGSTVRQLTGQQADECWLVQLVSDQGKREVTVFADGRHGWSDSLVYSDRPRSPNDEITPDLLRAALTELLEVNDVDKPAEFR